MGMCQTPAGTAARPWPRHLLLAPHRGACATPPPPGGEQAGVQGCRPVLLQARPGLVGLERVCQTAAAADDDDDVAAGVLGAAPSLVACNLVYCKGNAAVVVVAVKMVHCGGGGGGGGGGAAAALSRQLHKAQGTTRMQRAIPNTQRSNRLQVLAQAKVNELRCVKQGVNEILCAECAPADE
jgi:hypothetical protein